MWVLCEFESGWGSMKGDVRVGCSVGMLRTWSHCGGRIWLCGWGVLELHWWWENVRWGGVGYGRGAAASRARQVVPGVVCWCCDSSGIAATERHYANWGEGAYDVELEEESRG